MVGLPSGGCFFRFPLEERIRCNIPSFIARYRLFLSRPAGSGDAEVSGTTGSLRGVWIVVGSLSSLASNGLAIRFVPSTF